MIENQAVGVTGGKGFIGRHLSAKLREQGSETVLVEGDVCDRQVARKFVERCGVIYHLAGMNRGSDSEIERVNVSGVNNLAETAEELGDRHIIFVSSNVIERRPDSAYARSKLAGEERLAKLAGVKGCKATILRLANVYGPGGLPFYNSVVATFCWYAAQGRGGEIPMHGDGSQETDYVPVDEVVKALLGARKQREALTKQDVKGKTFSVKGLAETICDPAKRQKYPTLQTEYDFYAGATLPEQKGVRGYPLHSNPTGSFQELLHNDEAVFGQLSLCAIAAQATRGGHHHLHKEEWFCVLKGRMALDFYNPDGTYRLTQLLEGERRRFMHIPPPYPHVVRNIGADEVQFIIMCNEVFDAANPDTYALALY